MKKLSFILMLCTLLGLAGCSGSQEPPHDASIDAVKTAETGMSLSAFTLPLPEGMAHATAQSRLHDKIWVGGLGSNGAMMGFVDMGGESGMLELPPELDFVYTLCAVGENMAAVCGSLPGAYTDAGGEFIINDEIEGALHLLIFDRDGTLKSQTPLEQRYEDRAMIFKLMLEINGTFLLQSQSTLLKIDSNGAELGRITLEENNARFTSICMADGTLIASALFDGATTKLYKVDVDAFVVEETISMPEHKLTGLGFARNGGTLAISEKGLNSLSTDGSLSDELLFWEDLYLSEAFRQGIISAEETNDGYLFYMPYQEEILLARYLPKAEARTELLMATDSPFGTAKAVAEAFNKAQDKYYIKVSVYTEEEKTLDLLLTEITAGKGPDIFAFTQDESLCEIAPENLYINLFDALDEDSQFSREAILPGLLSSMTENDALYFIPYTFSIATFTAPESLVKGPGLTLKQAEKVLEENGGDLPLLPQWITKDLLLFWSVKFSLDSYIDWDAGECNFDSPGFIELLELCKRWASDDISEDSDEPSLMNFELLQGLLRISAINRNYGGDYCFTGFPAGTGNGSMFQLDLKFAISIQSDKQSGALEFLRFAISEEGQAANIGPGFFASEAVFSKALNTALSDGIKVQDYHYEFTEADAEKLRALVNETTALSSSDLTIINILTEEAGAYFSGIRTAADAAKLIQSRISLYINEKS